jgi:hypothetical protein
MRVTGETVLCLIGMALHPVAFVAAVLWAEQAMRVRPPAEVTVYPNDWAGAAAEKDRAAFDRRQGR